MAVPNTFQTATSAIPLANLDANFAYYDGAFSISGTATTFTGSVTLTSGTANGVTYLNGSKVLTSGSAFVFDGTNVGIGTSSPANTLNIVKDNIAGRGQLSLGTSTAANFAQLTFYDRTTLGAQIYQGYQATAGVGDLTIQTSNASSALVFGTNSTERARIDSSGNVGIGTSSPAALLDINGSSGWAGGTTGNVVNIKGANATVSQGGNLRVLSSTSFGIDLGGSMALGGQYTSGFYLDFAQIAGRKENATDGSAAGYLAFATRGTGNTTERMRIDSSGSVGIGTTSPSSLLDLTGNDPTLRFTDNAGSPASTFSIRSTDGTLKFRDVTNSSDRVTIDSSGNLLVGTTNATGLGVGTAPIQSDGSIFSGGTNAGFAFKDRSAATFSLWYKSGGTNYFYTSGASANVATINETTGIYTSLSDVNKKKDFELSFVGLDVVMQLQPKLFRMLSDDNTMPKQLGFIAQDVQPILPQAYVEQKSGDSTFIGLQDRPFIAALVKAIQEQQALITSLTARITALEST